MKIFVVSMDDEDGPVPVKAFVNRDDAQVFIDWEIEKKTDWNLSIGNGEYYCVPEYFITEVILQD